MRFCSSPLSDGRGKRFQAPAAIVSDLFVTLKQNRLAQALMGVHTDYKGLRRSLVYRWFTDPAARQIYARADHEFLTRMWASGLREVATLRGPGSRAAQIAEELLRRSPEFAAVWDEHEVGLRPRELKRFVHPEVGLLELTCQSLIDPVQSHHLLVYTATPGSESYDRLQLLAVIGAPTPY